MWDWACALKWQGKACESNAERHPARISLFSSLSLSLSLSFVSFLSLSLEEEGRMITRQLVLLGLHVTCVVCDTTTTATTTIGGYLISSM